MRGRATSILGDVLAFYLMGARVKLAYEARSADEALPALSNDIVLFRGWPCSKAGEATGSTSVAPRGRMHNKIISGGRSLLALTVRKGKTASLYTTDRAAGGVTCKSQGALLRSNAVRRS